MANNTLTNLIPDAYAALDVVSRELVGFIPSVARDPKADRAALNQTVRIEQTETNTAGGDVIPSMSLPAEANQNIGNKPLTLTKARFYPFSWSGEEQYGVNQGAGYLTIKQNQIAQAMRGLVNEIETDIATAAYLSSSRAYGTAGTTPFGTNLAEAAQLRKVLDDNGAPASDRSLVMNTAAGASIRTMLNNPLNANTSLNADITAQGVIMDLNGFKFRESAQVPTVAAGAMASATTSNAALTVGQTVLPLAAAGTGVVAAGDIITLANDSNKYVVVSVSFAGSNPASGDNITIAAPGIRVAQSAATRAITVVGTAARNVGFSRNAILLATRLPELPVEGDIARFREVITDDRSGISFEIAAYPGYRKITYQIAAVWGVKVIKPEHSAILLG